VKKVAVYKEAVAVQLPSRVVLYTAEPGAGELGMQYRSAAKINKQMDCSLLVVTSQHVVLCQVRCAVCCLARPCGVLGWPARASQ
jgi:intraflagellar transport protein 122